MLRKNVNLLSSSITTEFKLIPRWSSCSQLVRYNEIILQQRFCGEECFMLKKNDSIKEICGHNKIVEGILL